MERPDIGSPTKVVEEYGTWEEAAMAAQKLRITGWHTYQRWYKKDRRLPKHPFQVYPNFPGMLVFLGTSKLKTN